MITAKTLRTIVTVFMALLILVVGIITHAPAWAIVIGVCFGVCIVNIG